MRATRRLNVIGGRSQSQAAVTTVERYDSVNDVWATVAPLPTPLRYQHAAAINGKIYVAGGYPGSGPNFDQLIELSSP